MTAPLPPNINSKLETAYNVNQFRQELWHSLKEAAGHLMEAHERRAKTGGFKKEIQELFKTLSLIERYWAYPSLERLDLLVGLFEDREYKKLYKAVCDLIRSMHEESYRATEDEEIEDNRQIHQDSREQPHHYFEVLFVDPLTRQEKKQLKEKFREVQDPREYFTHEIFVISSYQDALIAVLFNYQLQSCVIRDGISYHSRHDLKLLKPFISHVLKLQKEDITDGALACSLGMAIKKLRPEIDLFLITDDSLENAQDDMLNHFRRIFYQTEDLQELHLSILRGIKDRYQTPFFTALTEYSKRPTSVFHALPISRGNSVFKSHWIKDMGDFYGRNLFLAETSSTTGGLDSLLQPKGPLRDAQKQAAKAFGSQYTYFVTNGTSTGNKIVQQALVRPGDIVLIDRDCHKSHHYGLVLAGAIPVYLESYPVPEYSMYGAVPLEEIKGKLAALKAAGRLDRVKMLILTNCTFDGIVYNVEKVMEEVLSIKPDMIFLWDEAWFGFAAFTPTYRQRTAMFAAAKLFEKYNSASYKKTLSKKTSRQLPDPNEVKIRVYATQSTHKTLSSFRQGSMIHIFDEEFKRQAESSFKEAYMTHTSTSPNYQLLASMDVGRRQTVFEGYELVERSIEMAMILREKITNHPQLKKYFDVVTVKKFIPKEHRESGLGQYYHAKTGWSRMEEAWENDEFVLDPTKINLHVGKTGVDGDTFKNRFLMDQFGIQINKTSRNTVLFMTNIGTTKSSVAYLIRVLIKITQQLEEDRKAFNREELKMQENRIMALTKRRPPLPGFSGFHPFFQPKPGIPGGDIRKAYFLAYDEDLCDFITIEACQKMLGEQKELVAASFVTPYPPGFPVLVPGQIISEDIIRFLSALDVKEIHGYQEELGFKVFKMGAIKSVAQPASADRLEAYTAPSRSQQKRKKQPKKEMQQ